MPDLSLPPILESSDLQSQQPQGGGCSPRRCCRRGSALTASPHEQGSSLVPLRLAGASGQRFPAVSCTPDAVFGRTVLLKERLVPRVTHTGQEQLFQHSRGAGELRHGMGTSTGAGVSSGCTEEPSVCPDKPARAAHSSRGQEGERSGERQERLLCHPQPHACPRLCAARTRAPELAGTAVRTGTAPSVGRLTPLAANTTGVPSSVLWHLSDSPWVWGQLPAPRGVGDLPRGAVQRGSSV